MKMTPKFQVSAMLNKQRQKEGKTQIYIRIYLDCKRSEISTQYFVYEKDWSKKTNKVIDTDPNHHLINSQIDTIKNQLTKQYLKLIALEEEITSVKLKNRFLVHVKHMQL
jgi:hypothetical protein